MGNNKHMIAPLRDFYGRIHLLLISNRPAAATIRASSPHGEMRLIQSICGMNLLLLLAMIALTETKDDMGMMRACFRSFFPFSMKHRS